MQLVKIPLSIIFGAVIIGFFIFFSQNPNFLNQYPNISQLSPTPISQITPTTANQFPTITSISPTVTVSDEKLIEQALITKAGIGQDEISVSISYNANGLARGGVKNKNEMSGAAWFAGKQNGVWIISYVGQGVPKCSEISGFDYPTTWLSHCVDSNGKTIER